MKPHIRLGWNQYDHLWFVFRSRDSRHPAAIVHTFDKACLIAARLYK